MTNRRPPVKVPLDGTTRRRVYLFRHGAVDYYDSTGRVVPNTEIVRLNAKGRAEAESMAMQFDGVDIDKALCSGLPRTRETAQIILSNHELTVDVDEEFGEIRPLEGGPESEFDWIEDVAYSHWRADRPGATFLGGESYAKFYDRVVLATESLLQNPDWRRIAVFAHGGTNAAILGWVSGVGLRGFGLFDQATCCLNIIDFDVSDSGEVVRKTIRGMNVTANDPTKSERHVGDMESMAAWMIKQQTLALP